MSWANGLVVTAVAACVGVMACGGGKDGESKPVEKSKPPAAKTKKLGKPVDDKQFARRMDKSLARFNPRGHKFGFEAAKIVFKHSSSMETGTVTAWIAESGAVIGVVRKMTLRNNKRLGGKLATRTVVQTVLWKDAKTTQWDDKANTVYVTRLRNKATELRLLASNDPKFFKTAGYAKSANESVAGKSCEVWDNKRQRVKLWRWKGVDLRYDNKAVKNHSQSVVAESVEVGAKLPADVFTPPKGYTIVDRTK